METIYGRRLEPGEEIQEGDVYDSSSGTWQRSPCPGMTVQEGCTTIWVRIY